MIYDIISLLTAQMQQTPALNVRPTTSTRLHVQVYTDADWAGDKSNRRSTSGALLMINGSCIQWYLKQQSVVALSIHGG